MASIKKAPNSQNLLVEITGKKLNLFDNLKALNALTAG